MIGWAVIIRANRLICHRARSDSRSPVSSTGRGPNLDSSIGTERKATSEPKPLGMLA